MLKQLLPSLLLVVAVACVVWFERKKSEPIDSFRLKKVFGPFGIGALIASLILVWLIPGGFLLVGPSILVLSIISPAGREAWKEFRRPRVLVSIGLVLMVFLGGFVPPTAPNSPESWGPPLFSENPNAPLYPAGEQYTWLMLPQVGDTDLEIVQSLSLRLPYQFGPFGAESSAFILASLFDMEQGRLSQAVELLDQELTAFRLDADEMRLEPKLVEDTYRYFSTDASIDETVVVRLYDLKSLSIGTNDDGFKVGEVLCLATSSWGGTLDILVIVRPIGHPGLSNDRFSQDLAINWLLSGS
tara:strand:+ start:8133 stop:9032 length:900 start_codon:yes stop_codon:yes gene_type:complete